MRLDILDKKLKRAQEKIQIMEKLLEDKSREVFLKNKKLEGTTWYLENILDTLSEGVAVTNSENFIQKVNPAFKIMFARGSESFVGCPINHFVDISAILDLADVYQDLLEKKQVEHEIKRNALGDEKQILMSLSLLELSDGVHEIIYTFKDISQRRMMENQLLQFQKLESIGEISAGVAHEINTPMQYIGDNIRFLKEELELIINMDQGDRSIKDKDEIEYLKKEIPISLEETLKGVQKVKEIVMALNVYSHPGSIEPELVSLKKVIEDAFILTKNEWKYVAEVSKKFLLEADEITLHVNEFSQVLVNLIINAIHAIKEKFQDTSDVLGLIAVKTYKKNKEVIIELSDNGKGIPKGIHSRLFDPFFTTKPMGVGSGQGLAISQRVIMNKEKGFINFKTEVDVGTIFMIHLPHNE